MTEIVRLYKDESGTLWRGPLYCDDKVFFATLDFAQEKPILVPGFVDPLWEEVDRSFGMSLEALNDFIDWPLDANASLIERARHVAVEAHAGQERWNGDDYMTHPMRVAEALRARRAVDDEQVVAYLHDVVEDTDVTMLQLKSFGFTESQLKALDSVTKRAGENYRDFILRSKRNSVGRAVKMADIEDNLRDLDGKRHKTMRDKYELAFWILEH